MPNLILSFLLSSLLDTNWTPHRGLHINQLFFTVCRSAIQQFIITWTKPNQGFSASPACWFDVGRHFVALCACLETKHYVIWVWPGNSLAGAMWAGFGGSRLAVGQRSTTTSWQTSLLHYIDSCDGTSLPLTVHPGCQSDWILLVCLQVWLLMAASHISDEDHLENRSTIM